MNTTPENNSFGRRGRRMRASVGELLVQDGLITERALDAALAASATTGKRLGRVLVQSGAITEEKLAMVLSRQLGLPFVDIAHHQFRLELIKLLPEVAGEGRACSYLQQGASNNPVVPT